MYFEVDRHTSVSDILEGFGTAPHLMGAYSSARRTKSKKAEARFYATVPHIRTAIDTTPTAITMTNSRGVYDS